MECFSWMGWPGTSNRDDGRSYWSDDSDHAHFILTLLATSWHASDESIPYCHLSDIFRAGWSRTRHLADSIGVRAICWTAEWEYTANYQSIGRRSRTRGRLEFKLGGHTERGVHGGYNRINSSASDREKMYGQHGVAYEHFCLFSATPPVRLLRLGLLFCKTCTIESLVSFGKETMSWMVHHSSWNTLMHQRFAIHIPLHWRG